MSRQLALNGASQPSASLPFRKCKSGAGAREFTCPLPATKEAETKGKVAASKEKGDNAVSEANQVVSGRGVRVEVSSFTSS